MLKVLSDFGLLIMLGTIVLNVGIIAGLSFSLWRKKPESARCWAISLGALDFSYLGLLMLVSLGSKPTELADGEALPFCGFYLDCHLAARVVDVRNAERITDSRPSPGHRFTIVKLQLTNTATKATLTPVGLKVRAFEVNGTPLLRNEVAEKALSPFAGAGLEAPIPPKGSYERTLVFEIPIYETLPRLNVMSGWGPELILESLLIGDEDSLGHARSYFVLRTSKD